MKTISFHSPEVTEPSNPSKLCYRNYHKGCLDEEHKRRADNFEMDLEDIAESLQKVMRVCGLKAWQVKQTRPAIKRSFTHYDEIRLRIDRVPRKRFCKEDFLHDMAHEADMTRMDSQMAYSIVKRAFRAYYYGTGTEGRRIKTMAKQVRHRQECLWLHAAKRTAEVFAAYTGLMHSEQQQYLERIECIYKGLYQAIQRRLIYEDDLICPCCGKPKKSSVPLSRNPSAAELQASPSVDSEPMEVLYVKQSLLLTGADSSLSVRLEHVAMVKGTLSTTNSKFQLKPLSNTPSKTSTRSLSKTLSKQPSHEREQRPKCTCPSMLGDREFTTEAPEITAECSQGPYTCRWLPFEEDFTEHFVPCPPMDQICPPCVDGDTPCDSECTCTCQYCHCRPAYDVGGEEEHYNEKWSASGVEDHDTDFCFLAPFRDSTIICDDVSEEAEEEFEMQSDEEEPFKCACVCEYKQRAYPHLFTYLASFKLEPQAGQGQVPTQLVTKENQEPQKPRCDISPETYRCWTRPTPTPSEDKSMESSPPHLTVLGERRRMSPEAPTTISVMVKNQHHQDTAIAQKTVTLSKTSKVKRNSMSKIKVPVTLPPHAAAPASTPKSLPAASSKPTPAPTPSAADKIAAAAKPAEVAPKQPASQPSRKAEPAPVAEPELTKEDILDIIGLK
ncbi:uncharacterized protein LOC115633845 [Scaptodrosophila lebanonensis]|uniref:Uncharacterized protein LOC115633845 n=1 Tax=Drosophila lebanonensis TaxID=7225 RepID=A0A6J2UFG1_DROLE|nr:uncharacterized protein LOC115633845 [Scaptodrosophila lebanonensis]